MRSETINCNYSMSDKYILPYSINKCISLERELLVSLYILYRHGNFRFLDEKKHKTIAKK